jgi:hypothetical protein
MVAGEQLNRFRWRNDGFAGWDAGSEEYNGKQKQDILLSVSSENR